MTAYPADVARRAAVIVQARGLAKGEYEDQNGRVCFLGAVNVALTGLACQPDVTGWAPITAAARARLGAAAPSGFVDEWNDLPATTVTDVAKLLLQVADDIEFGGAVVTARPRCGDLGDDQREYEFEPFGEPVAEPIVVPVPSEPAREPVPA